MTRQHAAHVPAHTHLADATNHLANARRSLDAAAERTPVELRLAVLATERYVRRLGKAAAKQSRRCDHMKTPAGAGASMLGMSSNSEANDR